MRETRFTITYKLTMLVLAIAALFTLKCSFDNVERSIRDYNTMIILVDSLEMDKINNPTLLNIERQTDKQLKLINHYQHKNN